MKSKNVDYKCSDIYFKGLQEAGAQQVFNGFNKLLGVFLSN
jgi:hypothetical protein